MKVGQWGRAVLMAWVLTVLCGMVTFVHGASVTLAWDAVTASDLAGYKLYYGVESGKYGAAVDVKKVLTYALQNVPEARIVYFAATAYDMWGNESGYSEECVAYYEPASGEWLTKDGEPPGEPQMLKILRQILSRVKRIEKKLSGGLVVTP